MSLSSPDWWDRFNRANVSLDAVTGTPGIDHAAAGAFGPAPGAEDDAQRGGLFLAGEAPPGGSSAAAARSVLKSLRIAPDSATADRHVRTAGSGSSRTCRHVVLQQRIAGADVIGATLKVHLAPDGQFVLTGRPLGDLDARRPDGQPKATPREAGEAAAREFDLDPTTIAGVEKQIFPEASGGGRWTYRVSMVDDAERYADVRAYLDASDLSVMLAYNIASALRGRAAVYPVSPGRTPALERVRLADLGPTPPDQLAGRRVTVTPVMTPPVTSPTRDFELPDTEPGFDEPNAYFHLRAALRYFGRLMGSRRLPSPPFRPIKAIVHDPSSPRNAFYGPTRGELRFGDFGDRPSARSADLIYHEFTHAVSDMAARLPRAPVNSEARGMSEGYSDYFSNTMLNDPRFGDWVAPTQARNAADPTLRFPPAFIGEEHGTGAVWAAVLWSIRQRLGARIADQITFESLFFLSPQSTFSNGRDALLAADRLLAGVGAAGGPNEGVIQEAWAARI